MSNPLLDRAAETLAALRSDPQFAALEPLEHTLIDEALQAAPELDRAGMGAAWMLLAEGLANLANQSEQQIPAGALINLAQLAGQRLYTGTGLPQAVRCPVVYDSGTRCKFEAKGAAPDLVDAQMRGHYATYHPALTWPQEPLPVISDSASPDWDPGFIDLNGQPRCSCGAAAAMSVGYHGERGPVMQCVACATSDPRTPFAHKDLAVDSWPLPERQYTLAEAVRELVDADAPEPLPDQAIGRCKKCRRAVGSHPTPGLLLGFLFEDGIMCSSCGLADGSLAINQVRRAHGLPEIPEPAADGG
jgi:hypothetical protein